MAVAPTLIALAVLLLPGGVSLCLAGVRGARLLALAAPVSIALVGATAILVTPLGIRFGPIPVLVAALVAVGIGALIGRRRGEIERAPIGALAVAILVAAVIISLTIVLGIRSPESPDQSYDGAFHQNAIASILQTGRGSSFTLYEISHYDGGFQFYPAAWHDLVALVAQLSGADVRVAGFASWLAIAVGAWVPGVAWLAATLFPARRWIAPVAAVLAAAFPAFPYLLLDWGVLYPTFLSTALVPTGLALFVLLIRGSLREIPKRLPLLACWGVAAGLGQPRSLAVLGVLLLPLVVAVLVRPVAAAIRDPRRRRRTIAVLIGGALLVLALAGAAWLVLARVYGLASRPIADHLNGGPATAHQGLLASLWNALASAPIVSPDERTLPPAIVLSVLVLLGAVLAARRAGGRWPVIGLALLMALYVLAAGSNSDLAKVATALWYKDKYRLMAAVPTVAAPLAALAVCSIVDAVRARVPERWRAAAPALAAVLLVAGSVAGPTLPATSSALGQVFVPPGVAKDGRLLDRDTVELLAALPRYVPADDTVIGNPWNGSIAAWSIGDRRPVFPHFVGVWGVDRDLIAAGLNLAGTDPRVCPAISRLKAYWFVESPGLLWGGDTEATMFPGVDRAAGNPAIMTEVFSVGSAKLYHITACGE